MTEKKKRIKKTRSDFRWLLVVFVIIFLAVIGRQEFKIYQIRKEIESTQSRIQVLQKEKEDLEAETKRLSDLKYIEKLAREEHNMVGKGEVPLFIVKDKEAVKEEEKKQ